MCLYNFYFSDLPTYDSLFSGTATALPSAPPVLEPSAPPVIDPSAPPAYDTLEELNRDEKTDDLTLS